MPQQPGEVNLLTAFADIHYFFSSPDTKPQHHRFDKSSYVYLYLNQAERRGRLQIANHAGTPDQDAFMGFLDTVRVDHSHNHPTLFTITVNPSQSNGPTASASEDTSQWSLPAPDQHNQGKYMFPLHTVDVYFWKSEDGLLFLDSLRKFVDDRQLRIQGTAPASSSPAEHRNSMSQVVQQLEQAAVSRPYEGRSQSVSTAHSAHAARPTAELPSSSTQRQSPSAEGTQNFAPMAYNPAAPAAPEPIAHREKTPPPPDAEDGTGLATAALQDHQTGQFSSPSSQHQSSISQHQQPYIGGPPSRTASFPPPPSGQPQDQHTYSQTPPPQGPHRQSSMPLYQQQAAYTPGPTHQPQQQQQHPSYASYSQFAPSQSPPMQPPGHSPLQPSGLQPQHQQHQAHAPAHSHGTLPGGYAQYSYMQQQQQPATAQSQSDPYSVHSQVYQPTQADGHGSKPPKPGPGQQPGKLEQRAERLEKGVGKFLKKLDKKF